MFQMNLIKKLKTSYSIRLSSDNRFLCHNMGSKTIVYNFNSWEKIIELVKPNYPSNLRFSNDNKYFLIKSTTGTICIYETGNFELINKIQSKKNFKLVEGDLNFTQDNMILDVLQTNEGKQIATIDIHSGGRTIISNFEMHDNFIKYNQFIPYENCHLLSLSYYPNETEPIVYKIVKVKEPIHTENIKVIDNPETRYWNSLIFNPVHSTYIVVADDYKIMLVDSNFKEVLKKINIKDELPRNEAGYFCHIHLSNDGKFIVVTYIGNIFILKYEDFKILLVEKVPYACFAEFSNGDGYLLIGTYENGYIFENDLR